MVDAHVIALIERLVLEYSGAFAAAAIVRSVITARTRLAGEQRGVSPSPELLEEVVRRELTHQLAVGARSR